MDTTQYVELSPVLANYSCTLQYDVMGNANVTIRDKSDGTVMLDYCLDDGTTNATELW